MSVREDYQAHVIAKIWSIAKPDEDADYDTNNLYDLVREGVEAKKRLAEGERAITEFVAGRTEEALKEFDNVDSAIGAAVLAERARGITAAIGAIIFEPGKSYIVLIAAGAIDPETLAALPPDPDCTFVFVFPPHGLAVWETACRMEINPGSVIFVEDQCISEDIAVDGANLVRVHVPPGKKLRDVLTAPDSIFLRMIEESVRTQERERCAKIAETAFDHMSPLAFYERYNADGKYVTRLNPEKSARAIAEKIRSGQ